MIEMHPALSMNYEENIKVKSCTLKKGFLPEEATRIITGTFPLYLEYNGKDNFILPVHRQRGNLYGNDPALLQSLR